MLVLLATCSLACASTNAAVVDDEEDAVVQVEDSLREAETLVARGEAGQARTLIAESEARIQRDLAHSPDRHQLLAHAAELRARIERPRVLLTSVAPTPPPAPAPVVVAPVVVAPVAAKEIVAPAIVEDAIEDEEQDELTGENDAVSAFEEGPLRDRGKALRMLKTAKRAPKKVSKRLYAEARALLESCANDGEELLGSSADLRGKSFRLGARNRSAHWIVAGCRSKVRSLDQPKHKKKWKKSKKRRFRQS